jgi:GntR family transcriptional regulator of vanillate catabolism
MDTIVKRRSLNTEQFSDFVRLNERYHALLLGLARSSVLTRAVERIAALPFASPSAFVVAQSALADVHQTLIVSQGQHRAILEAVAAGAGARAEKRARQHSNLAKRSLHAAARREAPLRKSAGGTVFRLQLAV